MVAKGCGVAEAPGGPTTVTAANGQTWTFPSTVVNGTYIDGSPWVYTTSTLPMPTLSTPATGTGATALNGGMINPSWNTLTERGPLPASPYTAGWKHGFDGRAFESTPSPPSMVYDETYNAHLSAATLTHGDTLVSAVSYRPDLNRTALLAHWSSNYRAIFQMAALTVVNYIPETDEFRPPYFGTTKTRWRWSDLDLGLLPNLTSPFSPKGTTSNDWHIDSSSILAAGVPDTGLTHAQAMRRASLEDMQWWLNPIYGTAPQSWLKPMTQHHWYPRDAGTGYGRLACYVLHNVADRDTFLKRIVQTAIDAYATASGFSGLTPFGMGAGFFATPLWFIRFAGLLFDDAGMKDAANISTGKTDFNGDPIPKWGEQCRVYYSATADSQYDDKLPAGYAGDTPLYGDFPISNVSSGQSSNGTIKDPNGVYDAYRYHSGITVNRNVVGGNSADGTTIQLVGGTGSSAINDFYNGKIILGTLDGGTPEESVITDYDGPTHVCTVSPSFSIAPDNNDRYTVYYRFFPNILDDTYVDYPETSYPTKNIGTYMNMNFGIMGCFLASIIMGDEAFWGGAVADFNRRFASDRQMWFNWGIEFDYNTVTTTTGYKFQRDIYGHGGSGNHWMYTLWDAEA